MATKIVVLATAGTGTWAVPSDCDVSVNATVVAIGSGSGGRPGPSANTGSAGGGGGASASASITLPSIGTNCFYSIGAAGTSGVAGADVWFNKAANSAPASSTNGVLAKGGSATASDTVGGVGGLASACIGTSNFNGGSGGARTVSGTSTGGGGAAGTGAGGTASGTNNVTGGAAGTGSWNDGTTTYTPGAGGNGLSSNGVGGAGNNYGGGGAGGRGNGQAGGVGRVGLIAITYTLKTAVSVTLTALTISSPTVPSLSPVTQDHVAIQTPMVIGSPTLPNLSPVTQVHVVIQSPMSTSSPTLNIYPATQAHVTTPVALSTSSPTLPTFVATQAHAIAITVLTTASPNIGAAWTPASLGAGELLVWFDGADASTFTLINSGAQVSQWNDKSGNSFHAIAPSGYEPDYISGAGTYDSNGSSAYLRLQGLPTSGYQFFCAGKPNAAGSWRTLLRDNGNHPILVQTGSTNLGLWNGGYYQAGSLTWGNVNGIVRLALINSSAGDFSMSRDGSALSAISAPGFGMDSAPVLLNNDSGGAQGWGNCYEVVFAVAGLSTDKVQKIEGYLAHKWDTALGVTTFGDALPSDHPYKDAASLAGFAVTQSGQTSVTITALSTSSPTLPTVTVSSAGSSISIDLTQSGLVGTSTIPAGLAYTQGASVSGFGATMFDANGKMTFAPHNLVRHSSDLSTITSTAGLTFSGTDLVIPTTENTIVHDFNIDGLRGNNKVCFRCEAKAEGYSNVTLFTEDLGSYYGFSFDLSAPSISAPTANVPYTSITDIGGGWFRIEVIIISGNYNGKLRCLSVRVGQDSSFGSFAGDGVSGIRFRKLRFSSVTYENAFRPQDDVETGANPYTAPRYDYYFDGSAWVPAGLLLEYSTYNRITPNINLWTKGSGTSAVCDAPDPNGDLIGWAGIGAWSVVLDNSGTGLETSIDNSNRESCSVGSLWIRAKSGNPQIYMHFGGSSPKLLTLDTTWRRYYNGSNSAPTTFSLSTDAHPTQLPTANIEICWAQAEDISQGPNDVDARPTSYVLAYGIRQGENLRLADDADTLASGSAASLVLEIVEDGNKHASRIIGSNYWLTPMQVSNDGAGIGAYTNTGGDPGLAVNVRIRCRVGAAWTSGGTESIAANGVVNAGTATFPGMSAGNTWLFSAGGGDTYNAAFGHIRKIDVYGTRLSDTDLQAATVAYWPAVIQPLAVGSPTLGSFTVTTEALPSIVITSLSISSPSPLGSVLWTPAQYSPATNAAWHDPSNPANLTTTVDGWVTADSDLSGNGITETGLGDSFSPYVATGAINGKQVEFFNGAYRLTSTLSSAPTGPRSFIFIIKAVDVSADNRTMIGPDHNGGLDFRVNAGRLDFVKENIAHLGFSNAVLTTNTNYIVVGSIDPVTGNYSFRVNGTGQGSGNCGAQTFTASNSSIGWFTTETVGGGFYGQIGERVILNVDTLSDVQLVEGYLAWKWGLQGSLDASHPYKASAPAAPLTITQVHAVTITPLSISSPSVASLTVSSVHTVSITALSIGSPALPTVTAHRYTLLAPTSSSGTWQTNTGGSDLQTAVDELVADDSDYIRSPDAPSHAISDLIFTLPPSGMLSPFKVRYRIGKETNDATQVDLVVRATDGSTTLAQWTHTNVTFAPATFEQLVFFDALSTTNLLLYSDLASNWGTTRATQSLSSDTPYGIVGETSTLLTASSDAFSNHRVMYPGGPIAGLTIGATYTYSVYCKAGTSNYAFINPDSNSYDNSYASAVFDVSGNTDTVATQTFVNGSGTILNTFAKYIGSGWFRLSITFVATSINDTWPELGIANAATGNTVNGFGEVNATGHGTETVLFARAQFEANNRATEYVASASTPASRPAINLTALHLQVEANQP